MKILRLVLRLLLVLLWFVIMTPYGIYLNLRYRRKGKWIHNKSLAFGSKVWGKGLAKILGLKINVVGDVNSVKGMIISNHLSYVDILTLSSTFNVRFTPKKEISTWPFLGWFIRLENPIWIDRSSRQSSAALLKEFAENVKNEINLIIFPEGTTTDGNSGLLPFKSTVFEAAVKENLISYPVLIKYKENKPGEVCWYGDMTLLGHAKNLLGLKKIICEVNILDPIEPGEMNRKQLAQRAHDAMEQEYNKIKL